MDTEQARNILMEEILFNSQLFQGWMNNLANSHEVLINHILIKSEIPVKEGTMLGTKISMLEKMLKQINTDFDKEELINSLRVFNKYWIITKHWMTAANEKKEIAFINMSTKEIRVFNDDLRKTISEKFTENQGKLMSIH